MMEISESKCLFYQHASNNKDILSISLILFCKRQRIAFFCLKLLDSLMQNLSSLILLRIEFKFKYYSTNNWFPLVKRCFKFLDFSKTDWLIFSKRFTKFLLQSSANFEALSQPLDEVEFLMS